MRSMTGLAVMALTVVLATLSGNAAQVQPRGAACDRPCLTGIMTRYLASLASGDTRALPLAPGVRVTEDGAEIRIGEGVWKSGVRLRPYRMDFIDVREGVAAVHAVLEEQGAPILFAARLKVAAGAISEIETMVVRNAKEGVLFAPDNLKEPNAAMRYQPTAAERMPRQQMIDIASRYPAGLRVGSFVAADVPFAAGAYRFENGVRMAGPGCTFQPPSCEQMRTQKIPRLPEISERLVAVDEEMGLVLYRLDFGSGSLPGANYKGQSLVTFEAFKVYGGMVHAVEAIFEAAPAGAPSGWDRVPR